MAQEAAKDLRLHGRSLVTVCLRKCKYMSARGYTKEDHVSAAKLRVLEALLTQHVACQYHFIRQLVDEKQITIDSLHPFFHP